MRRNKRSREETGQEVTIKEEKKKRRGEKQDKPEETQKEMKRGTDGKLMIQRSGINKRT